MSHPNLRALYFGAWGSLLALGAVHAEDTPADHEPRLEEVRVTATRSETSLQQTPVAVTALSGEALQERNVSTLLDVAGFVPSLSIGSRFGTGAASGAVSIRGMGVDAGDSSAAVGIYVDDVYFGSDRGNLLGLMDTERVEVLRGPQGTLFGRNTIAGAIQYVTRQPQSEFGGYVTGTGANFGTTRAQGALNMPLSDTFALRIAGMYDDLGGYVRDLAAGVDRGGARTRAARIKARWSPTDRLLIDLKGEYLDQHTDGRAVLISSVNPNAQFPGLAALFGETRPLDDSYLSPNDHSFAGYSFPDFLHFDFKTLQAVVSYSLSDNLTLKSITSNSWYRNSFSQDFDMTPLSILSVSYPHDTLDVFTQELQLHGTAASSALDYTVGAYYYDERKRSNPGTTVFLGFAPGFQPYGNPALNTKSYALYGQGTYNLTDRWAVVAGLRYSRETNDSYLIDETPPLSQTFTDWSPHLGVNFKLATDVMLYAKASKGFRAGGFTANRSLPGGGNGFRPETAKTYEVGARMEFLDRRLRINPTFFLTDWNSLQFTTIIPTGGAPVAGTDNAGDARLKGFELESQFAATERLQLNFSMSLLDAHYTSVDLITHTLYPFGFPPPNVPGAVVIVPDVTTDTLLPHAPKQKFSAGGRYSYPLANASKLTASLDYTWTATQRSAVIIYGNVDMPSYGLVNARLQYDAPGGHWSLAAYGTNLTNKFYVIGGVDFAAGYTGGVGELDPGRPREYGAEIRVNF
jgi:iron complex outermembrane receptor protein